MKNKLGFTLIELLAVIIILAIVALIATPIVLDVIEDARISAGKSEANMILGGINNYCANEEMKAQLDPNYTRICTSDMDKDDVPTMVNLGNATIDKIVYNGDKLTELEITSNNHKFILCPSGTFAMDDEGCPRDPNSLITKLLAQYSEGNTTGLVKDATNENLYYYTGTNEEVSNNFLWYGGHQWRVIEFDASANTLTLITQQPLTAIQPASAVWETQEAYESSYINTWLNDYFYNSLDSDIQNNILKNTFNVGIYTDVDEITTIQKVGLLDYDQYTKAGGANSFLDIKDYFWLGNRYSSFYVHFVGNNGNMGIGSSSGSCGVRAVIKISDLTITKGDGTLTSNYQVVNKAINTNEVHVGEYINVPYKGTDNACGGDKMCTFRVVSKSDNGIKVVLNGLLPTTSAWADNASDNITIDDLIYTSVLNRFISNIDSKYITTGIYGVGMYENGNSYTAPQSTTITANIGLPTVGEMFSGNDIDLSRLRTKTFVDVNTIENPTVSYYYWTMNRYSSSYVRNVDSKCSLSDISPTNTSGVRAVIYLKSGTSVITFTGGEGTAQSPYELQ